MFKLTKTKILLQYFKIFLLRQYIKIAILFSVFAFSGYNVQASRNFYQSTNTVELVFSINPQCGYQFNRQGKLNSKNLLDWQKQKFNLKLHLIQLNYGKLLDTKVKSYLENNHKVPSKLISNKHKLIFSSSDEEGPLRSSI